MHSKCLPNHPTAVFPDPDWTLTGNPNHIQEKNLSFSLPLEPTENPQHVSMTDAAHTNNALPMGPIAVAVNGVAFFNPFDMGGGRPLAFWIDAADILRRTACIITTSIRSA